MKTITLTLLCAWLLLPAVLSSGAEGSRAADLYKKAFIEQQRGDLDGALADYSRALELDPKLAEAYSNRGSVRQDKGDLEGALEDFNHALKLDPKRAPAYFNRGMIKYGRKDLDGALDDYNHGIKSDRKQPKAFYNRARIEEEKGDQTKALADYTRALKLNTNYTAAYASRGGLRKANGDLEGALADYNRALQLDPRRVSVYFNRGLVRQSQGNLDGALADFEQCSAHATGGLEIYARIHVWLLRAGRGERAAGDEELAAGLQKGKEGVEGVWASKIGLFLLDRIDGEQLLAATVSPGDGGERGRKCEYWYYSGMKLLLSGDKRQAAAAFRQCLATGERSFVEYECARAELGKLGGKD